MGGGGFSTANDTQFLNSERTRTCMYRCESLPVVEDVFEDEFKAPLRDRQKVASLKRKILSRNVCYHDILALLTIAFVSFNMEMIDLNKTNPISLPQGGDYLCS